MKPKTVTIQGHKFMTGQAECFDCGKHFKYCLHPMVMIWWIPLCSDCYEPSDLFEWIAT